MSFCAARVFLGWNRCTERASVACLRRAKVVTRHACIPLLTHTIQALEVKRTGLASRHSQQVLLQFLTDSRLAIDLLATRLATGLLRDTGTAGI
jgi:hypothetical protein